MAITSVAAPIPGHYDLAVPNLGHQLAVPMLTFAIVSSSETSGDDKQATTSTRKTVAPIIDEDAANLATASYQGILPYKVTLP